MSLPGWLAPLVDGPAMRATDEWAITERGIPGADLMERAGEGLTRVISEVAPAGRVAIVCGKGNNGGDGYVAARLLRQAGRDVVVVALWDAEWLRGDARVMAGRLPGDPPVPLKPGLLDRAHVVVDAILGTGFSGEARDPVRAAIAAVNAAPGRVVAVDVPSGVDASTGEVTGEAVRADATATFHRAKPGLWIAPGKAYTGATHVVDIGIPRGGPARPDIGLIRESVLAGLPSRGAASTKFTSGTVVVLGGSRGLTGAPAMAALAAQRAGAGYVSAAAPASTEMAFAARLLEAMFRALPDEDGALTPEAAEPAVQAVARADAAVLGPGLGRADATQAFVREVVERLDVPLVLDADGLNAMVGAAGDLRRRRWPTVLTPHAGELARLLEVSSEEIGARRLRHARAAADLTGAIVVLKGDDTLVASPGGRVAVSPGGAPALATAGTGDVLAGAIAALLARGLPPAHAACAGVYAAERAGRIAAAPHGPDGVIARDIIAALPAALAR